MRAIEKYSIGGYLFSFETDACKELAEYLEKLDGHYSSHEGGKEIMDGIEERFGELLLEKCGGEGVVSRKDVLDVISVLGCPEDIEDGDPEDSSRDYAEGVAGKEHEGRENKIRRRLYRDKENGRIAGVCSGLGAYFNLDPTIFRLAFIGLFLILLCTRMASGYVLLAYIILWMCMPQAKTVRQKDELYGESGTVGAIQERVERSMNNSRDIAEYDTWPKIENVARILLGVLLMITGACGICAIGAAAIVGGSFMTHHGIWNIPWWLDGFLGNPVSLFLTVLIVLLPFIMMLYMGIIATFRLKAPKWRPGLVMLILWFASITSLAVGAVVMLT